MIDTTGSSYRASVQSIPEPQRRWRRDRSDEIERDDADDFSRDSSGLLRDTPDADTELARRERERP